MTYSYHIMRLQIEVKSDQAVNIMVPNVPSKFFLNSHHQVALISHLPPHYPSILLCRRSQIRVLPRERKCDRNLTIVQYTNDEEK